MSWDKITKALAAVGGAVMGMLGGWNVLLTILCALMLIDYVTGVLVAWRGRSPKSEGGGVSSAVGFDGLVRKFFIMVVVLVATLLDTAIGHGEHVFQTAATMYYIANEGISVIENTSLMGVPYPAFIKRALEVLKQRGEEAGEKGVPEEEDDPELPVNHDDEEDENDND